MKRLLILLLVIGCGFDGFGQTTSERVAIKKMLIKEASTWRSGDIKGHASCWQIRPYSKILVSTADGTVVDVPPELMINPPAGAAGKGGSVVQSNFKMSIHGTNGWVSHDEESTASDGQKSYSYEIRMLEKINGQWKIVAQSIHLYKPK